MSDRIAIGPGRAGPAISAGTQLGSTGTVVLSNSNGISFGMAGSSQITATLGSAGVPIHNSLLHSGDVIPAAVQDFGNFAVSLGTAAQPAANATRLGFYGFDEHGKTRFGMVTPDGSQITHAQDAFIIVRNTSGGTIAAGKAVYVTGSTGQTPNVSPAKADSASTMPAIGITSDSINNNAFGRVQIAGVADQLDTSGFSEGDKLYVDAAVAGDLTSTPPAYPNLRQRVCVVVNSHASEGKVLVLSAAAHGELGIQAISGGTTRLTSGEAVFSNSNGVSFGVNGNTVTASIATSLTAIRLSAGTTSNLASAFTFSNSNGVSFGLNASTVTASIATSLTNINVSAGTTSNNLSALVFSNSNAFSFGLNGSTVTGSYTVPTVTNSSWTVSDAATSGSVARLAFTNSNGITMAISTGAGGSHTVTASYTVPVSSNGIVSVSSANDPGTATSRFAAHDHFHAGVGPAGVSNIGNTAGNTTVAHGRIVFAGGNNITLSVSSSNNNAQTITISGPNTAAETPFGISAGTQSVSTGTLVFSNSNGISFGMSGSSRVTASYTVPTETPFGISAGTQSVSTGTLVFSNSNNITFGMSGSSRVTASFSQTNQQVTAYAASNTTQSSSGTYNASSVVFAGAGIASVGVTNGSVVVSVPAGGGAGMSLGMSTAGNTSGTTGLVSNHMVLVATNNVTLSQSVNGQSATLTISGPTGGGMGVSTGGNTAGDTGTKGGQIVLVATNGLTLSQATGGNSATITVLGPNPESRWVNEPSISQVGTVLGNSLVSIFPIVVPFQLDMSNVRYGGSINVATAANNSSAYIDVSASVVLYTRNASTLSSINSGSNTFTMSWSSNASQTMTGPRGFTIDWASSTRLERGEYWVALHMSTTNTGTGANTTALANSISMLIGATIGSAAAGLDPFGVGTQATRGASIGLGVISSGATRGSIALSTITQTGTRAVCAKLWMDFRNESLW